MQAVVEVDADNTARCIELKAHTLKAAGFHGLCSGLEVCPCGRLPGLCRFASARVKGHFTAGFAFGTPANPLRQNGQRVRDILCKFQIVYLATRRIPSAV